MGAGGLAVFITSINTKPMKPATQFFHDRPGPTGQVISLAFLIVSRYIFYQLLRRRRNHPKPLLLFLLFVCLRIILNKDFKLWLTQRGESN